MTKRKRSEESPELLDSIFNRMFTLAATSNADYSLPGGSREDFKKYLIRLKSQVLSDLSSAGGGKETKKAAKEFTLEEAVHTFGLTYSTIISQSSQKHYWKIDDLPEANDFEVTPCIASLLDNYGRNFDRSSKAACRTAINFVLNECLTVMKGNNVESQEAYDGRPRTPKSWDDVKIYGEVSFAHKVASRATLIPSGIVVSGRADYGIGRVFRPRAMNASGQHKRRFHSLLLVVMAKFQRNVDSAIPQLFVYLASLHQSRLQQKRSDASVYGLASDGYHFIFVTISHEGVVKLSRLFDLLQGDMRKVLGCLKYILETANTSPNLMLERNEEQCDVDGTEDGDDPIDVDDNEFMKPPNGGDDDSEGDDEDSDDST